jgi:hypothetical protein
MFVLPLAAERDRRAARDIDPDSATVALRRKRQTRTFTPPRPEIDCIRSGVDAKCTCSPNRKWRILGNSASVDKMGKQENR